MKKLSLVACAILFAGCLSSLPTLQADLEESAKTQVAQQIQKPLELTYGKVLNEEELVSLNQCVSGEIVRQLTQEEKLFLGGSAVEKASVVESAKSTAQKLLPTSQHILLIFFIMQSISFVMLHKAYKA